MNRFLNKYALSCALITLLASCQSAPRVIADLEGNYPSRKSDSVKIYEVGKPEFNGVGSTDHFSV